jgi:hypothetical protein
MINQAGEVLDNVDVNKILAIDNLSKPISGFKEPMITVCVLPDENIFVSVYHRVERMQYYFVYSHKEKKVVSKISGIEINHERCSLLNFPIKSFYSAETQNCLTFYR